MINISDIKILFVYNSVEIKTNTLLTRRICIILFLDNPETVQVKYEFVSSIVISNTKFAFCIHLHIYEM